MKIKFIPFENSLFFKQVSSMFKGNLIAQIIGTIGTLFLAKLYSANNYGYYSVFLSFTTIASIILTQKFEYVIITEKSNKNSLQVFNFLLFSTLVIGFFFLLLYLIFASILGEMSLNQNTIILGLIVSIIMTASKIFESLAIRLSIFNKIAFSKVLGTFSTITFQFLLYQKYNDGLILGTSVSCLVVFLFYTFNLKNNLSIINIKNSVKILRENIGLFKFQFPSELLNSLATNTVPILILFFFSSNSAGVYALSLKIVSLPLFLLSSSISQVYFQKSSELFNTNKKHLFNFTLKIVLVNISIMTIVLILINTIGFYFLLNIFKFEWENLKSFIILLSILTLFKSSFSPISFIIVATKKNSIGLIFNIYLIALNLSSIFIGHYFDDILITIKILAIFGGLGYIILLSYFLILLFKYKHET